MKHFCYLLLSLFLVQCANDKTTIQSGTTVTASTKEKESTTIANPEGCFRKVTGRDTLLVQIKNADGIISGEMAFDNYEKDSSHGNITGNQDNGLIVVWYDFNSEGMDSHAQYVFKVAGSNLIIGTPDMDYKNDSSFIKNISAVQFDAANILIKVPCK